MPPKALSLVLSSRNDSYSGNSTWRLKTALDFLGTEAARCGLLEQLEVLVCDWGSGAPLAEALELGPDAAEVTRFLHVPEPVAAALQRDSPFPEVLANNAAIRRAQGAFVGRIDQDTLVSGRFLEPFFSLSQSNGADRNGLADRFVFMGRKGIPRLVAERCPTLAEVRSFIERHGDALPREGRWQRPPFDAPVGVVLMSREMWRRYRGYDESLLYWGFMETDLGLRTAHRDGHFDLERELGCPFFHLGHTRRRLLKTTRRKNLRRAPTKLVPNGSGWGLADVELEPQKVARVAPPEDRAPVLDPPAERRLVRGERIAEGAATALRGLRSLLLGERIRGNVPEGSLWFEG